MKYCDHQPRLRRNGCADFAMTRTDFERRSRPDFSYWVQKAIPVHNTKAGFVFKGHGIEKGV